MRIEKSDITVSISCVYKNTDPIWMMKRTCDRFGITPRLYGLGDIYGGWVDIMLRRLMEEAHTCPTSHMLYTDGGDAFFLAGLDEVTEKYNAMRCPPLLIGADVDGFSTYQEWYDKVAWDQSKPFKYFQVGGMLCEAKALYEAIRWMYEREGSGDWGHVPGDNPPWWCNFMAERPGELSIDHDCQIFQNCTNVMEYLRPYLTDFLRLKNEITKSLPCILHFQGGYTDQKIGKWPTIRPIWRVLGYTENPPWESR